MPSRREREPNIVPSLLDRLLDDEPGQTRETLPYRTDDVRGLRRAVARDLETLLNTRQEALEEIPESFEEVRRSLLVYGLPDFTALSLLGPRDRARIRHALEYTIATFEPRLERVRISMQDPEPGERVVRFRVEGWLRIQPAPEPVAFDTVLQLTTRDYIVQDRG